MSTSASDDLQRTRDEYAALLASYDHARFLAECRAHARLLIEDSREGARYIASEAMRALSARSPLLMIRLGDAEANLLRFAAHPDAFEQQWVDAVFRMNDAQALAREDSLLIAGELQQLVASADILGLRPLCPAPLALHLAAIPQTIDSGDLRGALGMISAFTQAEQALRSGQWRHTVLTSAWVHLTLLEHLEALLAMAPRVIVVSGRQEIVPLLQEKLGARLAAFLALPLQASDQSRGAREPHYPRCYRETIRALGGDLRGTLVLVGGGILGKKYCAVARDAGAVALDLGSAFDILAGQRTRPVHSIGYFMDLERTNWLGAGPR